MRARARSLADELEAVSHEPPPTADRGRDLPRELDAATAQLQEQTEQLCAALADEGLTIEALDEAFANQVRLVAEAHRARRDLERVKAERKAASAELEAARDGLFRFLVRHGEAPVGGAAETGDLAAGLERVAARQPPPD